MQVTDNNYDGLVWKLHGILHSNTPCQTAPTSHPTSKTSKHPRPDLPKEKKKKKHESHRERTGDSDESKTTAPCSNMKHITIRKTCPSVIQYGRGGKKVSQPSGPKTQTAFTHSPTYTRKSNNTCTKCTLIK